MQTNLKRPETLLIANTSGAGNTILVNQPGTDKRIVLCNALSDAPGWLVYGDDSAASHGGKVCYLDDQGQSEFNVIMDYNQALWKHTSLGGNQSVTYYIT